MNCSNSMAPTTEELIRVVLDGERLSQDAQAHLDSCHICQARIAYLQQVEPFLVSRLYRSECPDVMQLHYYCLNQLPLDKAIATRRHIEYCPLCAHEVQDIMHVLDSFETPPATLSSLPSKIRSVIATLMPWQPQLVTRHGSSDVSKDSWPRQYRADSVNISLHLSRSSTGDLMLLGLLTSDNPDENIEMFDGVPVDLYVTQESILTEEQHAHPVMSSYVDDLGNVAFKAVSVGEYTMVVHLPS
ncbi:MAG TPA: hypothetical protein VH593_25865, partial [Ktedonobacteraceae bacterium]